MIRSAHIILFLAALTAGSVSYSQEKGIWSGSISVSGGSSFKLEEDNKALKDSTVFSNYTNETAARLGYTKGQLSLSANASFSMSHDSKIKDAYNVGVKQSDTSLVQESSRSHTDNRKFKVGAGAGYEFDDRNNLKLSYLYSRDIASPYKVNITYDWISYKLKGSEEAGYNVKGSHQVNASYEHKFVSDPRRTLAIDGYVLYAREQQKSEWDVVDVAKYVDPDDTTGDELLYRLTPEYLDREFKLSIGYDDPHFGGVSNLSMQLGLDARLKMDDDESKAATYINGTWVDSTSYHEVFSYRSLTVDPRIHASYKWKKLELSATYVPDIFTQKITNDKHQESLEPVKLGHIFDAGAYYHFGGHHSLSFSLSRSIKRPDYKQICWYLRPGAYYDEFYQGNPDLKAQVTHKLNLSYVYSKGRFATGAELGASLEKRKIEQTFYQDTVGGVPSRVKTWINGGTSQTPSASVLVKWNGKRFKADAKATLNYNVSTSNNGTVKKNSDWSVNANLSYAFKYDWTVSSKFRYQSKIIRSYTTTTEYLGWDIRAQKKLGRFLLYVEGVDLLDKEITTTTISADETSGRVEAVNNCRRTFRLGASFSF